MKFVLLWLLIEVGGHLPARVLYVLADLGAAVAWGSFRTIRNVTRDHMAHVLGPTSDTRVRDRAARGCVRTAARYWVDLARTSHLDPAVAFEELDSFEGIEHLFAAYDGGRGIVLVTAHLGAPEFVIRTASQLSLDILALTERLEPPMVNALVHRARRRHGGRFIEADRAGVREAVEQLRRGGLVALMADRNVVGTGVPTQFFGAPAPLPAGPIELALRTGAAVVPCFVFRKGGATGGSRYAPRWVVRVLPPLAFPRTQDRVADRRDGMNALARALESGIAAAPDQWFVLQPVWSAHP